jgi:hypothetical protein
MFYEENGRIDRSKVLSKILEWNLPEEVRNNINEMFGKKVYFEDDSHCIVGTLVGLEQNGKYLDYYYIVENQGNEYLISHYERRLKLLK